MQSVHNAMRLPICTRFKLCDNRLNIVTNCPFLPNVGIPGKVLGVRGILYLVAPPDTDATVGTYVFPRCGFAPTGR